MIRNFVVSTLPSRVIFGVDTASQLSEEVQLIGGERVLVLSTHGQRGLAEKAAGFLGSRVKDLFDGARMHTPTHVTEQALNIIRDRNIDTLVAVGGGSAIGLSKALALRTDLPQVVLPTTYAGSEMTPILGETKDGIKTTLRDPRILPEVVIYDVKLSQSLPREISTSSGINAMAHAIEALYAQDSNPTVSMMAREAIHLLSKALPVISQDPNHLQGRYDALYGAWLAGVCLASVGMSLHHKLCHVLGGSFDLPHAQTHSVILPYVIAYNEAAAYQPLRYAAQALGVEDVATAMSALIRQLGLPSSLKALGMPQSGIAEAARLVLRNAYWNPRPIEESSILHLIDCAWHGRPWSDPCEYQEEQ